MRILVTGAAGMVGRRLVARLLADGHLGGRAITAMVLHDVAPPPVPMPAPAGAGIAVDAVTGDLSAPGAARALIAPGPDVVFHIAGVVSGSAESDFDLGLSYDFPRLLCDKGAVARHPKHAGQRRGTGREWVGRCGPCGSVIAPVFSHDLNG